ncbi:hypothetical protein C9374_003366 [Naegleria lovaniensis]|uniref:Myosin-binding domain-containing protein n=1 Tax=Naegleria lovaniensis TaxID=51637 RepID=A0AA88GTK6_NAELO|nr:uncharacterized protein C9374_003366 [Naegleria lovaniensis]KAG2385551.1 hypothetical protein C9374_003366 [Naegleria lovaniensis]
MQVLRANTPLSRKLDELLECNHEPRSEGVTDTTSTNFNTITTKNQNEEINHASSITHFAISQVNNHTLIDDHKSFIVISKEFFSLCIHISSYIWAKTIFLLFDYDKYYKNLAVEAYLDHFAFILGKQKAEIIEDSMECIEDEASITIEQPNSSLIIILFTVLVIFDIEFFHPLFSALCLIILFLLVVKFREFENTMYLLKDQNHATPNILKRAVRSMQVYSKKCRDVLKTIKEVELTARGYFIDNLHNAPISRIELNTPESMLRCKEMRKNLVESLTSTIKLKNSVLYIIQTVQDKEIPQLEEISMFINSISGNSISIITELTQINSDIDDFLINALITTCKNHKELSMKSKEKFMHELSEKGKIGSLSIKIVEKIEKLSKATEESDYDQFNQYKKEIESSMDSIRSYLYLITEQNQTEEQFQQTESSLFISVHNLKYKIGAFCKQVSSHKFPKPLSQSISSKEIDELFEDFSTIPIQEASKEYDRKFYHEEGFNTSSESEAHSDDPNVMKVYEFENESEPKESAFQNISSEPRLRMPPLMPIHRLKLPSSHSTMLSVDLSKSNYQSDNNLESDLNDLNSSPNKTVSPFKRELKQVVMKRKQELQFIKTKLSNQQPSQQQTE